jgi:hypothetical protein
MLSHWPVALHLALTKPSGVQASVVVQLEPIVVEPQTLFHASGMKVAEPFARPMRLGAMLHVSAAECYKGTEGNSLHLRGLQAEYTDVGANKHGCAHLWLGGA